MAVETIKLEIAGMTCDDCAKTVINEVDKLDGIIFNDVSYPKKTGEFQIDTDKTSSSDVINAINSTGHYKVVNEIVENANIITDTIDVNYEDEIKEKQNNNFDYDLIIIGGGSAAFSAAIKASELEKKVLMFNEGLPIGGTCVNVGCVPSKTLIRAAEQLHTANHPNFIGIISGGSTIDFREIIRKKTELVGDLREAKYIDVLKDDPNVTIVKARATLIDKTIVEADGKNYSAENILLATGSSTFIPDIPGLSEVNFLINDTLYEVEKLPEHLIVIGGRYIALENAQMFARLGSKVTILQRSFRIIPDETTDVTESLKGFLEEEGIEIKTGVKIKSVENRNGSVIVNASVKDEDEVIEGSHIFVATGRKGNTSGMGLENLGVEPHKDSFIKTNEFLQTNIPNIYSAGDVTGEYLFVYSAAYEGSLAVNNMFGEAKVSKDYSVFPWVIFTDPQVAGVGMDEDQAYKAKINYDISTIQLKDIPRSIAARNTKGFIKLIRNKDNNKLIGARILASEGSELLMEISLAIKFGLTVTELKDMFHPYLTLSEGVKLAAIGFDKDVKKLSCCAV
ncbi:Mercuric ion reductase [hydrothermal vent metagenome]|uniref:Mercuric reductase n=1 Tax=hydrothermal vent metagenome TaxID=652676 RepID=A0A3B1BMM4_9ZZZZ